MGERNKRILMDQLKLTKNKLCADCNAPDPEWASSNIGVFMCVNCSGIHRMLGTHISRVKSCRLDQWTDDAVQFMCEKGNDIVNTELECHMPLYYQKPTSADSQVYKEHFVRSKYGKKEFLTPGGTAHYETGRKEGSLWKRGKDDSQFKLRKFVLNADQGTLKYYVKPEAKDPKQTINLSSLSVTLAPEKIDHSHGLQLSFIAENRNTRQIYLYADKAEECVDWYLTLRAASVQIFRKSNPEITDEEIIGKLTNHRVKQGWMLKTGPKHTEPFRKRWCTLENRKLMYFANPLDAYPRGEIFIGNGKDGFFVKDGLPPGQHEPGFGFTISTPDRDFLMSCDDKEEQKSWINEIKAVITRPLDTKESEKLEEFQKTYSQRRKSINRSNWKMAVPSSSRAAKKN